MALLCLLFRRRRLSGFQLDHLHHRVRHSLREAKVSVLVPRFHASNLISGALFRSVSTYL